MKLLTKKDIRSFILYSILCLGAIGFILADAHKDMRVATIAPSDITEFLNQERQERLDEIHKNYDTVNNNTTSFVITDKTELDPSLFNHLISRISIDDVYLLDIEYTDSPEKFTVVVNEELFNSFSVSDTIELYDENIELLSELLWIDSSNTITISIVDEETLSQIGQHQRINHTN